MTDPIPKPIFDRIKTWLNKAALDKEPCQVVLHGNGAGKIVFADRVVKDRVAAG